MSETDLGLPDAPRSGEGHAVFPWIVPEPPGHGSSTPLLSLKRVWIWVLGAVSVLAGGTVLYEMEGARPLEAPGVGLRIERQGNDMLLLWDASKPAIRRAARGSLSISDGSYKKQLDMDPAQLRTGRVFYSADTGDVLVQLDVVDRWGRHTGESARVLGPARDTTPVQNAVAQRPPAPPAAPEVKPAVEPAHEPASAPVVKKKAAHIVPRKAVVQATVDEPVTEPPRALPLSAPPQAPAAEPDATAVAARTGGYVGPRVAHKVNPRVPPDIRASLKREEVVRLMVSLDASGRVVAARPVASGNTELARLAEHTLDQWRFEPAKLNGSNVPGDVTLVFRFHTESK